jgi:hypothetical protein
MATKREVLEHFSQGQGTLYKADDDEPIFVLRAQDKFFVPLVRMWIELVEMDTPHPDQNASVKILDAAEVANAAIDWGDAHPGRVKVPD